MRLLPHDKDVGWVPYAYLLYLSMFFVSPVLEHATAREWALVALATVVFLPMYFAGYWIRDRRLLWIIGGITALGLACGPWNVGASVFFVYAAAFAGFAGSTRLAAGTLATIVAVIAVQSILLHLPAPYWISGCVFSVFIGGINVHFAQRKLANRKLRVAQEEIERLAKVAERERIARDLHDLLGHTLSLIVLKSELAGKLVDRDPQRARDEIRDLENISRDALSEVRQAVRGIRAGNLANEIARARATLESAGIVVECVREPLPLTAEQETVLAMAVREGVTNVVRHARATRCEIRMRREGRLCAVEISDDGIGGTDDEGFGLRGMRERAEAMGGSIRRETGAGSKLAILLPLGEAGGA